MFPSLRGRVGLKFEDPAKADLKSCDIVFFATPNGIAMQQAPALLESGFVSSISLPISGFAISPNGKNGTDAACLPRMGREGGVWPAGNESRCNPRCTAGREPGCYPTAVQLGFKPLVEAGLVEIDHLVADAKSGVSGAGRKAETHILFSEASDNFKAYGVPGHRHLPEIRQGLAGMAKAAGRPLPSCRT